MESQKSQTQLSDETTKDPYGKGDMEIRHSKEDNVILDTKIRVT